MPLGGFLSLTGKMQIWDVIMAGAVGSVAGQTVLYFLARKLGEARLRAWVSRHGRWLTISPEELDRAARWFHDHGGKAVLFGRMMPGVRSLISIPAGIAEMPLGRFIACTLVGATGWTAALAYAGRFLGRRFENVERYLTPFTWVVVGVAGMVYLYRVFTYKPRGERLAGV